MNVGTDESALRDAATVLVVRDGRAGPEVLLLQRNARAVYVAGDVILKRPDGASRLAYLTEINADGVAQDWPLPASSDSRAVAVVTLDERRALVVGNEFRGVVDPAPGRPVSEANLTTWLLARPE